MTVSRFFKIVFIVLFGAYAIRGAFDVQKLWLLDGVNLLFHEAGHPIFQLLGNFMGMAGGTLAQLLIPAGITIAFFIKEQPYAASVTLLWYGENFFNIAHYMKDARAQALPLIGGGIHDWGYLLGKMHLLEYDQWLGNATWCMGFVTVIAAIASGIYFSNRS